mmetsp:Transcript_60104/g.140025  ORF Transcript_60104/g.140025 Transcript_60104/m.140025 type:complete len:93 (+) Transcript_60104:623-901(+)
MTCICNSSNSSHLSLTSQLPHREITLVTSACLARVVDTQRLLHFVVLWRGRRGCGTAKASNKKAHTENWHGVETHFGQDRGASRAPDAAAAA